MELSARIGDIRAFLVLFCLMFMTFVQGAFAGDFVLNRNHPIVDQEALKQQEARFEFDENGNLVDGPRRHNDDPVDFSSILREEVLKIFFFFFMGCVGEDQICDFHRPNIEGKKMKVKILAADEEAASKFVRHFKASIGKLGFELVLVDREDQANLVANIASQNELRKILAHEKDEIALGTLDSRIKLEREYGINLFGLSIIKRNFGFCHVSQSDTTENLQLYLDYVGLEKCISRVLMQSLGYIRSYSGSDRFSLPTSNHNYNRYTAPTFTDFLYTAISYTPTFPTVSEKNEIERFWDENISAEITRLRELDSRGELATISE